MINSPYIQNILLLLIKGNEHEAALKKQIDLLTDDQYTYTGAGLFVDFVYDEAAAEHKVNIEEIVNGVLIESPELELGANASLFLENGIIAFLEIISRSSDYPEKTLDKYTLSREQ